jgi:hypothetical protein
MLLWSLCAFPALIKLSFIRLLLVVNVRISIALAEELDHLTPIKAGKRGTI